MNSNRCADKLTQYRTLLMCALAAVAIVAAIFSPAQEAYAIDATHIAGSGVYTLEEGKAYEQFDITGDGLSDTLLVTTNADVTKACVYVNGSRVCMMSTGLNDAGMFRVIGVKLAVLRNGKSFLSLDPCGGWQTYGTGGLYQYRAGKLKKVISYNKLVPKAYGSWMGLAALKVAGNKLTIRPCLSTRTVGRALFDFTYSFKSGTLKRTSKMVPIKKIFAANSISVNKKFVAKRDITVYKNKSCKAKKLTVRKGQKVQFRKMYVSGKSILFQVNANGKTGWIKGVKKGEPPFEDLYRS